MPIRFSTIYRGNIIRSEGVTEVMHPADREGFSLEYFWTGAFVFVENPVKELNKVWITTTEHEGCLPTGCLPDKDIVLDKEEKPDWFKYYFYNGEGPLFNQGRIPERFNLGYSHPVLFIEDLPLNKYGRRIPNIFAEFLF